MRTENVTIFGPKVLRFLSGANHGGASEICPPLICLFHVSELVILIKLVRMTGFIFYVLEGVIKHHNTVSVNQALNNRAFFCPTTGHLILIKALTLDGLAYNLMSVVFIKRYQ